MDPLSEFEFVCSLSKQPSPLEFFTDSSGVFNLKSDLTLIVGTMKFYCHRSVLSLTSPVLTRMFDGEFQEHHAREVPLKGKTSESILELLTYIYPQFHREINDRNVEKFISLADEYMIEFLKKPCQEFLAQQLESFKVVVLPTQQKFEKPSMRSKSFHGSESALNSSRVVDIPVFTPDHSHPSHGAGTINPRHQSKKLPPISFKPNEKANTNPNTHLRYVLVLDKAYIPTFYDAYRHRTPFTSADVALWLRRLRILYCIEKRRDYDEVIDSILSILQFIPGADIFKLAHKTAESCQIDETMINDIARARMYMLEEWASDGNEYRSVDLTDSYRATIMEASFDNTESSNVIGDKDIQF